MKKLTIFDDGGEVATITVIDDKVFIFACDSRVWSDVNRWVKYGFHRYDEENRIQVQVKPQDADFLEHAAKRAQDYNFSTELLDK